MRFTSLSPLRHRDFALLWSGGLVSNAGTWMQTVAVGALVIEATEQAFWAALVTAAAFLPIGLFTPLGGALADRLDRRRFVMIADGVEAGLAGVLAILAGADLATPGTVIAIVFLGGCSSALRLPFQQSMLPDVVPREDLLGAVSLGSAQFNLGRVVGPALAGVVVAAGSFQLAFTINALSYLAAIAALALVRLPHRAPVDDGTGVLARIRAGAAVAKEEPGCRAAIGMIAAVAFLASPFIALIPAVADNLVEGGAKEIAKAVGALTTAQGIGAVVGSLALVPLAERFGRNNALVVSLLATPISLLAYAFAPSLPVAFVALVLVGGAYIGVLSGLSTVVQLRAPAAYRGRVLSLYMLSLGVVYPIGALVQGALADVIGLATTTGAFALLLLAGVTWLKLIRSPALASLEDVGSIEPGSAVPVPDAVVPEVLPPVSESAASRRRS